jgi:hypothetical protein
MSGFSGIAPSSGISRAAGATEQTSADALGPAIGGVNPPAGPIASLNALTVLHGKEIRERLSFPGDGAKWRPTLVAWQYGGNNELTIFYNWGGKKLEPAFFEELKQVTELNQLTIKGVRSSSPVSGKHGWREGLPGEPYLPPQVELRVRELQASGTSRLRALFDAAPADTEFLKARVRWELKSWAPGNISDDMVGFAAKTRRLWLLDLLLQHGADPNASGDTMDLGRLESRASPSKIPPEDVMSFAVGNLLYNPSGRRRVHPVVAALNPEASGPITSAELSVFRRLAKGGAQLSSVDLAHALKVVELRGGDDALRAELKALELVPEPQRIAPPKAPPGKVARFFQEAWDVFRGRKFLG